MLVLDDHLETETRLVGLVGGTRRLRRKHGELSSVERVSLCATAAVATAISIEALVPERMNCADSECEWSNGVCDWRKSKSTGSSCGCY